MDAKTKFEIATGLISAAAELLWPIVVLIIVLLFRRDLSAILSRLRRGKLFGQELEMDPSIDQFQRTVGKAAKSLQGVPVRAEEQAEQESQHPELPRIVGIPSGSPNLSLLALSSVLENERKVLVASTGHLPQSTIPSAPHAVDILSQQRMLPAHAIESIRMFWDLRNRIVHGKTPTDEREAVRIIDIGSDLLQLVRMVPHEQNFVAHVPVDLFDDEKCTQKRTDVKGLILETTSPRGKAKSERIFPTTRPEYYEVGKRVSWEWNLDRRWGNTWYINPTTKQPTAAWASAGEFVGRHIDDLS